MCVYVFACVHCVLQPGFLRRDRSMRPLQQRLDGWVDSYLKQQQRLAGVKDVSPLPQAHTNTCTQTHSALKDAVYLWDPN